jgi:hypothetical protein
MVRTHYVIQHLSSQLACFPQFSELHKVNEECGTMIDKVRMGKEPFIPLPARPF